jgi:hypothetical protein
MSKGVSWYQPFVQLLPAGSTSSGGAAAVAAAAVAAAGGGRDPAKPLGCFTVQVQPHLPLIKVRNEAECVCFSFRGGVVACLHGQSV